MILNSKMGKINYEQFGKGKDIVLLHGWGQNIEMMKPLANLENYRYTIIDFPGFGKSPEPDNDWTIYDYAQNLYELVKTLKIKKPIIVGHSFGGRVAIAYAAKHDTEKIVLLASPIIREPENVSFKTKALKSLAKISFLKPLAELAKKYIGSTDYKNASETMRKILVNVVNQDLSNEAQQIKVPTLLIWGSNDQDASLEGAKKLETIMSDAGLVVLNGLTHYAYLEDLYNVQNIIKVFIEGE